MDSVNRNFLLGYGERLMEPLGAPLIKPEKTHPYSIDEAIFRLTPQINSVTHYIEKLDKINCPNEETVVCLDLNPSYLAKSYYPGRLLNRIGLRSVGSKIVKITPDKWSKKGDPELSSSLELFLAGKRDQILRWQDDLNSYKDDELLANDLRKIERVRVFDKRERIKGDTAGCQYFEVALHASCIGSDYIIRGFEKLLKRYNLNLFLEKRIQTDDLCFLPLECQEELLEVIEQYSFLRHIRKVPGLRIFNPVFRGGNAYDLKKPFPQTGPLDPSLKVAVFDGGCKHSEDFKPWVVSYKFNDIAELDANGVDHGSTVNSAILFGSIDSDKELEAPYANVHHYAVLGDQNEDPFELYNVLHRIKTVLNCNQQYKFLNFSIGPDLPIEDDDIHPWTAVLDDYLARGDVLATIAVGNNGENDKISGNARVQVPSDCVNAISIGASSAHGFDNWTRASYSALGPGRSPGKVKPDILAFGGVQKNPFWVVSPDNSNKLIPVAGTSYSAPIAMRMALGIKAHFKDALSVLAIKALLIHRADTNEGDLDEAGWGCLPEKIDDMVLCKDGTVTVVYQGELEPKQYIRAEIPMPAEKLKGKVELTATFCFASEVDSKDPANYTRSGLEVKLRPHVHKKGGKDSSRPKTRPFFKAKPYASESELRNDVHKWETVLHGKDTMQSNSLEHPFFEIHYNARSGGQDSRNASSIPFALVVTVEAKKEPELYDKVLNYYRTQLEAIQPVIEIPLEIH